MKKWIKWFSFLSLPLVFTSCGSKQTHQEPITKQTQQEQPSKENINSSIPSNDEKGQKEYKKNNDLNKKTDNNQELWFDKIRIGHWNILNHTGKQDWKNEAIAKIINHENLSLVGLTEVTIDNENNELAVSKIIEKLKEYDPDGDWKYLLSPKLFGKGKESQQEYIGIVYKNKFLEPIPFAGYQNNKNPYLGIPYPNPEFTSYFNKKEKTVYARPPYGAHFRVKNQKHNDFTVVFSHFDSPGQKRGVEPAASGYSGQGQFEINEAKELKNVLNWFDLQDGKNNDIFFMGDTNIKENNGAKAFDLTIKAGYKTLLDWNLETSLGRSRQWSEPYDKILYKGDLKTSNAQRFDIFSVFKKNIIEEKEWKKKVDKKPSKDNLQNWILKISDHTLVYTDLDVSKDDIDE
ncbi:endonuclease/exonuclease/phosphatase family protein [Mycoplasma sp. AC157]